MSAPIPLRRDFGASQLRGLAKKTKDGPQARRLLALAAIYDGATRTEAAMIGGVGLQIIRDWVLHFNERGPDGLLNGKSPGQPSKLNDVQRQAIAGMIESGPIPAVHGVVRWRLIDLAQWIFEEFRIAISSRHHRAANAKFRIKFKNSNKHWKLKTVLAGRGGGRKKSIFLEALRATKPCFVLPPHPQGYRIWKSCAHTAPCGMDRIGEATQSFRFGFGFVLGSIRETCVDGARTYPRSRRIQQGQSHLR